MGDIEIRKTHLYIFVLLFIAAGVGFVAAQNTPNHPYSVIQDPSLPTQGTICTTMNEYLDGCGGCGDGDVDEFFGELCDAGADNDVDTCTGNIPWSETGILCEYCGTIIVDELPVICMPIGVMGPRCGDGNIDAPNETCEVGDSEFCINSLGYEGLKFCDENLCVFGNCQSQFFCGDGLLQEPPEECDDGCIGGKDDGECDVFPLENGDGCEADCTIIPIVPVCGDGVQEGDEECDDGEGNSDTEPDACRTDCTLPICGDGVADIGQGEQCDDGQDGDQDDGCTDSCLFPFCSDGWCQPISNGESGGCGGSCQADCGFCIPPPPPPPCTPDGCNGLCDPGCSHAQDPDCGTIIEQCGDGCFQETETCLDVSPACGNFQAQENEPLDYCSDTYDNDCDGPIDGLDDECMEGFHSECSNFSCVEVEGDGLDECDVDDETSCTYSACDGDSCVEFPGPDESSCSSNAQCETTHAACVNQACVQVPGGDEDDTCDLKDPMACEATQPGPSPNYIVLFDENNNVVSSNIFQNPNDRIGIGTEFPFDNLHVVGTAKFEASSALFSGGSINIQSAGSIGVAADGLILVDGIVDGKTIIAQVNPWDQNFECWGNGGDSLDGSVCAQGDVRVGDDLWYDDYVDHGPVEGPILYINKDGDGRVYKGSSSLRYKEDVKILEDEFDVILEVEPKTFNYKNGGMETFGLIAEDLDELGLKWLVYYNPEGEPESIHYQKISVYLTESIKERQKQIEELRSIVCANHGEEEVCDGY